MKTLAAALVAALLAGAAQAQPAPPPPGPGAPPPPPGDNQGPPPGPRDGRPGRGAFIKLEAPGGAEIAVRCADGESTRACMDVVVQLLERTRSMHGDRRRDWDRDRGGYRGGGDYRGDRDND
ncbi:hypothetical protein [Enterovirga sp. CN4-39]|uniref:hypothetical protein n=1 Tax=Enterovirga sp. CN4-39 TaxID=3400910 RepID=UPI003C086248